MKQNMAQKMEQAEIVAELYKELGRMPTKQELDKEKTINFRKVTRVFGGNMQELQKVVEEVLIQDLGQDGFAALKEKAKQGETSDKSGKKTKSQKKREREAARQDTASTIEIQGSATPTEDECTIRAEKLHEGGYTMSAEIDPSVIAPVDIPLDLKLRIETKQREGATRGTSQPEKIGVAETSRKRGRPKCHDVESLLAMLVDFYQKNGHAPSIKELRDIEGAPSYQTVAKNLGSAKGWEDKILAAIKETAPQD